MKAGVKLMWRALGWTLFLFGLIGLLVPLFPTTIFWILAAMALQRSDPAFAERIRRWPKVGPTVADFLDHGVINRMGKITALAAMGASGGLMIALIENEIALGAALATLAAIALYVATRPSRPRAPQPTSLSDGGSWRAEADAALETRRETDDARAAPRADPNADPRLLSEAAPLPAAAASDAAGATRP